MLETFLSTVKAFITSAPVGSSLEIIPIKYESSAEREKLDLVKLPLKESAVIFLISSMSDYYHKHGNYALADIWSVSPGEEVDQYNSVTANFLLTTYQKNQYVLKILSHEIPNKRYENLRLYKPIDIIFNLSQGCGLHKLSRCTAREDVWRLMFNEEISRQEYWKDSLSIYYQRMQANEKTK